MKRMGKIEPLVEDKLKRPISLVSPEQPNVAKLRRGRSSKSPSSEDMVNRTPKNTICDQNSIKISNMKSLKSKGTHAADLDLLRYPDILPDFIGKIIEIKVVPVSPRFQVEVPEWDASVDISILIRAYISESKNSKWLGAKVWPITQSNEEIIASSIGNGRPNSCSCESPGSANCVRKHIEQERKHLQHDLGPAFFSWMFNEIGEQVLKLWTVKAQRKFNSLLKKSSSPDNEDWIKRACKFFHHKHRKDIVNYYFDVYIPRRISLHTRSSSLPNINTDDEDEPPDSNLNLREKSRWRTLKNHDPKSAKPRFLRGH